MSARGNIGAGRLGTGNDGSDHAFRQRVDDVYQLRADCKSSMQAHFKKMGAVILGGGATSAYRVGGLGDKPEELLVVAAVFGAFVLSVLTGRMSISGLTPSSALLMFYMIFSAGGCMAAVLHIALSSLKVQPVEVVLMLAGIFLSVDSMATASKLRAATRPQTKKR